MNPMTQEEALAVLLDIIVDKVLYVFLAVAVMVFFKDTAKEVVSGVMWRFRSPYRKWDTVIINNTEARITRMGLLSTDFFTYNSRVANIDGTPMEIIVGGRGKQIPNHVLSRMDIEIPLRRHEDENAVRPVGVKK